MNSKELLNRIIEGDQEAFRELVDLYKAMVYSLCYQVIQNQEDAEEVAQDVFVKVFLSIKSYREESKLSTWIYKIAYNTAVSKTRKIKRKTEILSKEIDRFSFENPSNLDSLDKKKYLKQALLKLHPNERGIVMMYYYEELSIKEITEITGMTKSNVKIILFRTRVKLKGFLQLILKNELEWMIQ